MPDLQLAAVDLGSNSFRLEIGRAEGRQIYVLDSMRSNVRLAAGLNDEKKLSDESQTVALAALSQFGQRLNGFPANHVRAVATNTLRVARNAKAFISHAEAALGFPVEVIAGREEARLIFSGVAHTVPSQHGRRLVVDIGGGSTEISVGSGTEPDLMESLYIGSINVTMTHFSGGFIDDYTLKQAELAARRELQPIVADVMVSNWTTAIGSSGTARTIARLLKENRVCEGDITQDGMRWLRKAMLCAGRIEALSEIRGLKADRALNLPGGFAILSAIFSELGITRMQVSDNSLRLGVLYDLLDRNGEPVSVNHKRDETVSQFAERYHADVAQGTRISRLASQLLIGVKPLLRERFFETQRFVSWAALLSEIGLSVAHNGYHKHSAYIAINADMPGFSKDEQKRLGFLVLGHTGKLPKLTREAAPLEDWLAVLVLRLATLIHRSRHDMDEPQIDVMTEGTEIEIRVDSAWLAAHPLTAYSLAHEARQWALAAEHKQTPPIKVNIRAQEAMTA
jgi:exopolyphosphatase / guanosine-5'-triphosphate,3'-diphosphate pyrophosphatase